MRSSKTFLNYQCKLRQRYYLFFLGDLLTLHQSEGVTKWKDRRYLNFLSFLLWWMEKRERKIAYFIAKLSRIIIEISVKGRSSMRIELKKKKKIQFNFLFYQLNQFLLKEFFFRIILTQTKELVLSVLNLLSKFKTYELNIKYKSQNKINNVMIGSFY